MCDYNVKDEPEVPQIRQPSTSLIDPFGVATQSPGGFATQSSGGFATQSPGGFAQPQSFSSPPRAPAQTQAQVQTPVFDPFGGDVFATPARPAPVQHSPSFNDPFLTPTPTSPANNYNPFSAQQQVCVLFFVVLYAHLLY